ncbi:unnamed protein product [Medioppia subpectinata]|uniref:Succinate dehydrogenase cytochrome b560 subunit, mitochondrial n=1 Tax=Medioppia subpectinata TaxID=1979941 RepID=A0A7R9LGW7_9ACAR|nr:unnamed protein product [Medioppia subpectinata]CAG2118129.1 unnamed protein product [Medioppia subpectinata]
MLTNVVLRRVLMSTPRSAAVRLATTSSSVSPQDDYFAKNAALNRPVSPWINYKLQVTSVLSFSHRMTGLALSALVYGGGIAALYSHNTNFAQVLQSIQTTVPHSLIFTVQVLTATSLAYHTLNGVRHLSWDFGYGFSIKELYTSGYLVIGLTVLSAIAFIMASN